MTMELRIHGQVTACICRTTTDGRPLLEVELKTPDGQAVHARHIYPCLLYTSPSPRD